MTTAKPCPFCGSKLVIPQTEYKTNYKYYRCNNCGARSGLSSSSAEAIKKWNRRVYEID